MLVRSSSRARRRVSCDSLVILGRIARGGGGTGRDGEVYIQSRIRRIFEQRQPDPSWDCHPDGVPNGEFKLHRYRTFCINFISQAHPSRSRRILLSSHASYVCLPPRSCPELHFISKKQRNPEACDQEKNYFRGVKPRQVTKSRRMRQSGMTLAED